MFDLFPSSSTLVAFQKHWDMSFFACLTWLVHSSDTRTHTQEQSSHFCFAHLFGEWLSVHHTFLVKIPCDWWTQPQSCFFISKSRAWECPKPFHQRRDVLLLFDFLRLCGHSWLGKCLTCLCKHGNSTISKKFSGLGTIVVVGCAVVVSVLAVKVEVLVLGHHLNDKIIQSIFYI